MSDFKKLDEIKKRANAATPGKWELLAFDSGHSKFEMDASVITADVGDKICDMVGLWRAETNELYKDDGVEDGWFIANARQDVPLLVETIEEILEINTGNNRELYGVDFEAGMAKALWLVHQIVKEKLG